jgi:hypothetical protein
VPSIGGGTKLIRTLLAGEEEGVCSATGEGTVECSGETEEKSESSVVGEAIGVDGSCAAAIPGKPIETTQATRVTLCSLSIVAPVYVWENVVPPFAIAKKFFIDHVGDKLIVQAVETSKVIDRALARVFASGPGFH